MSESVKDASVGLEFNSVQQGIMFKLYITVSCPRQRPSPLVFVDAALN